jgi:hypothetical protein
VRLPSGRERLFDSDVELASVADCEPQAAP